MAKPFDFDYLAELTGMSRGRMDRLMKYHGKLPLAIKGECERLKSDLIRQHRKQRRKGLEAEFLLAQFLVALSMMEKAEDGLSVKRDITHGELAKVTMIRAGRIRAARRPKASPKRDKIETVYRDEIRQLRETEGLSWREVATYLKRHHRVRITAAYLQRVFARLDAEGPPAEP